MSSKERGMRPSVRAGAPTCQKRVRGRRTSPNGLPPNPSSLLTRPSCARSRPKAGSSAPGRRCSLRVPSARCGEARTPRIEKKLGEWPTVSSKTVSSARCTFLALLLPACCQHDTNKYVSSRTR